MHRNHRAMRCVWHQKKMPQVDMQWRRSQGGRGVSCLRGQRNVTKMQSANANRIKKKLVYWLR